MVIENLIKEKWIEQKAFYSFIMGVGFTILGFLTSYTLFKDFPGLVGIAAIFFTVMLALPSVARLFSHEEKIDVHLHYIDHKSKEFLVSGLVLIGLFFLSIFIFPSKIFFLLLHLFGLVYVILYVWKFFRRHHSTIDFFVYFFIGAFLVFLAVSLMNPWLTYSLEHLTSARSSPIGLATQFSDSSFNLMNENTMGQIISIMKNNMYVMIVAFLLSLFYGSGALFLITLNGSIFAAALSKAIRIKMDAALVTTSYVPFVTCNMGIMAFHGFPEVLSYLLAAIAGGILSKALIKEKLNSRSFRLVAVDSLILFLASIIVLIMAATVEVDFSKQLFMRDVCFQSANIVNIVILILFGLFVAFEWYRIREKKELDARYNKIVPLEKEDETVNKYVKMCLDMGYSEGDIKKHLLKKKISEHEINNALHRFRKF